MCNILLEWFVVVSFKRHIHATPALSIAGILVSVQECCYTPPLGRRAVAIGKHMHESGGRGGVSV